MAIGKDIENIKHGINKLVAITSRAHANGGKYYAEDEDETKPSGSGAFAGMIAGDGIGLLGRPPGGIIGGILGVSISDESRNTYHRKTRKKNINLRYMEQETLLLCFIPHFT